MKKIFLYSALFILVDLLLFCIGFLVFLIYDYFSYLNLFEIYKGKYGLAFMVFFIASIIVYFVGYLVYLKRNTIVKSFYNIRNFFRDLNEKMSFDPIDETPATLRDMRNILKDMQNTLKSESFKQQK